MCYARHRLIRILTKSVSSSWGLSISSVGRHFIIYLSHSCFKMQFASDPISSISETKQAVCRQYLLPLPIDTPNPLLTKYRQFIVFCSTPFKPREPIQLRNSYGSIPIRLIFIRLQYLIRLVRSARPTDQNNLLNAVPIRSTKWTRAH